MVLLDDNNNNNDNHITTTYPLLLSCTVLIPSITIHSNVYCVNIIIDIDRVLLMTSYNGSADDSSSSRMRPRGGGQGKDRAIESLYTDDGHQQHQQQQQ